LCIHGPPSHGRGRGHMNDQNLIERLRKLQEQLAETCTQMINLRVNAERHEQERRRSEHPERRHVSRTPTSELHTK
jgi:hypothetical protein